MKLLRAEIKKYKSFQRDQLLELSDGITVLVGKNESGKTSALECMAKTNYFQDDDDFEFNFTLDYPRREKKQIKKADVQPAAITCTYEIDDSVFDAIEADLGAKVLSETELVITYNYGSTSWVTPELDIEKFGKHRLKIAGLSSKTLQEYIVGCSSVTDIEELAAKYKDSKHLEFLEALKIYYSNEWNWSEDPLWEYIARVHLKPSIPKFLYYDEYFSLPSRISIEELDREDSSDSEMKTARALFELADIDTEEIVNSGDFERFVAELEATEAIISEELFKYWRTNKNLSIAFQIDKRTKPDPNGNVRILEHVLDVRVKNKGVSLSLKNRSRGFNWFFSFLVWFMKIQEDKGSKYILLLDEPGLNLHASAQADLLRFIEDLSENYQIVYTTHSPFMIPPGRLDRVRTIVETEYGSIVSDSVQERDPDTLFPLQAALGYDIAQNLFISPKNLLVEGISDMAYLQAISGYLESSGRASLRNDVTLVPTGGLGKVATFVSLLRGSELEIVCLLDTPPGAKGKQKMDEMVRDKLIRRRNIRYFEEFAGSVPEADIEDMFEQSEYLTLFNSTFGDYRDVRLSDLDPNVPRIVRQISTSLGIGAYNHHRPANTMIERGVESLKLSDATLGRFEVMFKKINALFVS